MLPVLFTIFGLSVQTYGVSKVIAALVGAWLLGRAFRRLGWDKDLAHSLVLWATLWGFVAAKAYFLLENVNHLSWHMLGGSGFTWYGGLMGGTVTVVVLARRHHLPLGTVAGAMAAPLSVAYGIGRIGCFLAGDGTYGAPSNLPWAMAFPNGAVPVDVPVHPTQLYETLGAFIIAGILMTLQSRWKPIAVFGAYLTFSGLARLLVEFVRTNERVALGLTQAQLAGLASILVGTVLIVHDRRPKSLTEGTPTTPRPSPDPAAEAVS